MYLSSFSTSASLFSPAGCLADPAPAPDLSPCLIASSSIAAASPESIAAAASAWSVSPEVFALRPVDDSLGTSVDDLVWVGVLGPS